MQTKRLNISNQKSNSARSCRLFPSILESVRAFAGKLTGRQRVADEVRAVLWEEHRHFTVQMLDFIEDEIRRLRKKMTSTARRRRCSREMRVFKRLKDALLRHLESLGLQQIPQLRKVDPSRHTIEKKKQTRRPDEDGLIVEVIRSGYLEGDVVWRRARVVVLQYTPKTKSTRTGRHTG